MRQRADYSDTERPHGTIARYNYNGCRCVECRAAWAAYQRQRRATTRAGRIGQRRNPIVGKSVAVDLVRLADAMLRKGFNPHSLSIASGYSSSAVPRLLRTGTCGYYTLDTIACALGFHPIEFAVDKEGWWAV
jgi:hypothetical protein